MHFRLWCSDGYSVFFGTPSGSRCVLFARVTLITSQCREVSGPLIYLFIFSFSSFEKSVTDPGPVPAGPAGLNSVPGVLQPIKSDSACSHLRSDWFILKTCFDAGKSFSLVGTQGSFYFSYHHLVTTVFCLHLYLESLGNSFWKFICSDFGRRPRSVFIYLLPDLLLYVWTRVHKSKGWECSLACSGKWKWVFLIKGPGLKRVFKNSWLLTLKRKSHSSVRHTSCSRPDGALHHTLEVGFSKSMTFCVITNALWSRYLRLESRRNLDDPEFQIWFGCPFYQNYVKTVLYGVY